MIQTMVWFHVFMFSSCSRSSVILRCWLIHSLRQEFWAASTKSFRPPRSLATCRRVGPRVRAKTLSKIVDKWFYEDTEVRFVTVSDNSRLSRNLDLQGIWPRQLMYLEVPACACCNMPALSLAALKNAFSNIGHARWSEFQRGSQNHRFSTAGEGTNWNLKEFIFCTGKKPTLKMKTEGVHRWPMTIFRKLFLLQHRNLLLSLGP